MFAFITSFILFLAETPAPKSAFMRFYDDWLNIPGFEAWKFVNLAFFITVLVYIGKKPLSDAFKAKRDAIRSELIRAEEEKQAALAKLTTAEAKLAQLETEKTNILQKAKDEAAFEKKRVAEQTKIEATRLRQQSEAELARISNQTRA